MKALIKVFLSIFILQFPNHLLFAKESQPQNNNAREYRLGVLLGLSGSGRVYSKDGIEAIKLAVDEINATGGMLGKHKIKLFIRNTNTKSDVAVREAAGLILRDKVDAILGTYSSSNALAIKPLIHENKTLLITAISNSENITKDNFSPYVFSVGPNSYMQAAAVAIGIARLAQENGWKTYSTIASNYEWGYSTQQNVVELLKKQSPNLRLISEEWPRLGELNFTPYISSIAKLNPDFVLGVIASLDNIRWIHTANATKFFDRFPYPGSLLSVSELIRQEKILPRGMIGVSRAPFFAHLDNKLMNHFVDTYRKEYGRYPTDWAVLEYDAVNALKQGIDAANSLENSKVSAAMSSLSIKTTRGNLAFRPVDNQLNCSSYFGAVTNTKDYSFPIYGNLQEITGAESMRSPDEIIAYRKNKTASAK